MDNLHREDDVQHLPAVSVVVVVYGEEPWLELCVRSLLDATGVISDVVLVEKANLVRAADEAGLFLVGVRKR